MGLELNTTATIGRKKFEGKLYLDSKFITFKSQAFGWSAELARPIEASAAKDRLMVAQDGTKVAFDVGSKASRWVEKILNPPTRITKLGVKPGQRLWLSAGFDKPFRDELKQSGATLKRKIEQSDLAFWRVRDREQLAEFDDLSQRIPDGINLWIVWDKGSQAIGQTDVMQSAQQRGWGPSKTAAFDETLSSMRFARKKVT